MDHIEFGARVDQPGSVLTGPVAEVGHHPRLVEGKPVPDPVPEPGFHRCCVVSERMCRVPDSPTSGVFDALRMVPVVQSDERLDTRLQEPVHQPVVEVQTRLVGGTAPFR